MTSIAWTATTTSFGELLLAASGEGVVALAFASTTDEAAAWLESEFPGRPTHRDDEGLRSTSATVLGVLDGDGGRPIPLAAIGTDFQERVWHALRSIPFGQTRTYTQLAAMVGRPHAVRAVASACAKNPISILVPCHRVVGADGSLRGYRWGLERKHMLLEHERHVVQSRARSGMARSA